MIERMTRTALSKPNLRLLVVCGVCLCVSSVLHAQPAKDEPPPAVTCTTDNGKMFEWTIRNQTDKPIDRVDIPACSIIDAFPPPGWLCKTSAKRGEQTFVYVPETPKRAISPGGKLMIQLVATTSSVPTSWDNTVTLYTSDGQAIEVTGVFGPASPNFLRNFGVPAGWVVVTLIIVAYIISQSRKKAKQQAPPETTSQQ